MQSAHDLAAERTGGRPKLSRRRVALRWLRVAVNGRHSDAQDYLNHVPVPGDLPRVLLVQHGVEDRLLRQSGRPLRQPDASTSACSLAPVGRHSVTVCTVGCSHGAYKADIRNCRESCSRGWAADPDPWTYGWTRSMVTSTRSWCRLVPSAHGSPRQLGTRKSVRRPARRIAARRRLRGGVRGRHRRPRSVALRANGTDRRERRSARNRHSDLPLSGSNLTQLPTPARAACGATWPPALPGGSRSQGNPMATSRPCAAVERADLPRSVRPWASRPSGKEHRSLGCWD